MNYYIRIRTNSRTKLTATIAAKNPITILVSLNNPKIIVISIGSSSDAIIF